MLVTKEGMTGSKEKCRMYAAVNLDARNLFNTLL